MKFSRFHIILNGGQMNIGSNYIRSRKWRHTFREYLIVYAARGNKEAGFTQFLTHKCTLLSTAFSKNGMNRLGDPTSSFPRTATYSVLVAGYCTYR